ncbi:hypothetical protein EG68_02372 [Paragonimus skrjabini miyazakii]|uniref:Arginase n=1 Tax=Paragonimus skrjabini miyazakii TaxID=59628 RepID=A0A8S9Z132_9TREM|nr:hypothetical protein EG68_02372 [Paragonimus skrjabini miyazakii]
MWTKFNGNLSRFVLRRSLTDLKSAVFQRDKQLPLYPHVHLIGAPVRRGQPNDGTHLGPRMIRESNVIQSLKSVGITVEDHGDIALEQDDPKDDSPIYNMINPRSFVDTTEKIATNVEHLLRSTTSSSQLPTSPLVVIGGDHSMATGTILGHWRVKPNICIIWVDSHGDLNTPFTCVCGNMHGFPLAFLLKEIQDEMPHVKEMESIEPCLTASDIVYIGLRDLDPHEVYDLRKNNIKHFTMMDVDRMGIEAVIQEAIHSVNPRLDRPIHLSFDIDAMDPSIAPSTGTPVPGGLTLREGLRICEEVYATGKLSMLDLAELNPMIGTPEDVSKTQATALSLLKTCLGYNRSGHLPKKVHLLREEGIPSRADKLESTKRATYTT